MKVPPTPPYPLPFGSQFLMINSSSNLITILSNKTQTMTNSPWLYQQIPFLYAHWRITCPPYMISHLPPELLCRLTVEHLVILFCCSVWTDDVYLHNIHSVHLRCSESLVSTVLSCHLQQLLFTSVVRTHVDRVCSV